MLFIVDLAHDFNQVEIAVPILRREMQIFNNETLRHSERRAEDIFSALFQVFGYEVLEVGNVGGRGDGQLGVVELLEIADFGE